jgi:hypothetical protein
MRTEDQRRDEAIDILMARRARLATECRELKERAWAIDDKITKLDKFGGRLTAGEDLDVVLLEILSDD